MRVIVRPENAEVGAITSLVDHWMTLTYGWVPGAYLEWCYRDIPRRVIVEEYVGGEIGPAHNLKVHCFHGVPRSFTVTYMDRGFQEVPIGRFMDFEDQAAAACAGLSWQGWVELLEMCSKLTAETDMVRLDWLLTPEGPRFGEFTHFPAGGSADPTGHETMSPAEVAGYYDRSWTVPKRYE
jgi:hypothetical protein